MKTTLTKLFAGMVLAGMLATSAQAATTLKMALDADPVSLDPHEQISSGTLMSHLIFDPLVRWDKNMQIEARLAEKLAATDDKTMRFSLRKDDISLGNKLTSNDVKGTFETTTSSADFKAIFEPFAKLNVIDDYTFDLVTKEPFPLVLNAATYIFPMEQSKPLHRLRRQRTKKRSAGETCRYLCHATYLALVHSVSASASRVKMVMNVSMATGISVYPATSIRSFSR